MIEKIDLSINAVDQLYHERRVPFEVLMGWFVFCTAKSGLIHKDFGVFSQEELLSIELIVFVGMNNDHHRKLNVLVTKTQFQKLDFDHQTCFLTVDGPFH